MSWASLLKGAGKAAKWFGKGAVNTLEGAGKVALHPAQSLKAAGTAVKTAAVGGGLGYVGWKKLTTDESVVGIVSDAIIGKEATQKVEDTVHGAVDGIRDLKESVGGMTERVSSAAENVDGKLNGISSFIAISFAQYATESPTITSGRHASSWRVMSASIASVARTISRAETSMSRATSAPVAASPPMS